MTILKIETDITDRITSTFFNHEYENFLSEINEVAKKETLKIIGEDIMIYPCGFAWLIFTKESESTPFVKWLLKEGMLNKCPITRRYSYWVSKPYNQSLSHKEHHAKILELILRELGIKCSAESKYD